jgi:DNA-binding MarR family transcriptional regulator
MSQQEVLNILAESPDKWFDTKAIQEKLGISPGSVNSNCKKLRNSRLVMSDHSKEHLGFIYKHKY